MRLIARIDVKNGYHIKTIQCEGVQKIRKVADSIEMFSHYINEHDEIIVIDVVASLYGFENWLIRENINHLYCPIPLAIGGGINSVDAAINALSKGADKIVINTSAIENPLLLERISRACGMQAVVLQIDTKKVNDKYMCFTHGAREMTSIELLEWIKNAKDIGVGEIHLTSIDTEGMPKNFPLDLAEICSKSTDLPLIISGGIRSAQQIKELHDNFGISAFSFSSITNLLGISIGELRSQLTMLGIKTRCLRI
jgi:cyclase